MRYILCSQRKSAATVAFKLSVVRSFFAHLRAAGVVTLNPAATRLVPPPEVSSQPAGRSLTVNTVRFTGECGEGCTFTVTVQDNGGPGTLDTFGLSVTGTKNEVRSLRVISRGNIRFHF